MISYIFHYFLNMVLKCYILVHHLLYYYPFNQFCVSGHLDGSNFYHVINNTMVTIYEHVLKIQYLTLDYFLRIFIFLVSSLLNS